MRATAAWQNRIHTHSHTHTHTKCFLVNSPFFFFVLQNGNLKKVFQLFFSKRVSVRLFKLIFTVWIIQLTVVRVQKRGEKKQLKSGGGKRNFFFCVDNTGIDAHNSQKKKRKKKNPSPLYVISFGIFSSVWRNFGHVLHAQQHLFSSFYVVRYDCGLCVCVCVF